MPYSKRIAAVSIPGAVLSATLAVWHGSLSGWPSPTVAQLAWVICACYAAILLMAGWEVLLALVRRLPRRLPKRQAKPAQAAQAGPQHTDAQAKGEGALPWDSLPVVAIPHLARTARESVIAFAGRHGLTPYEAERGFVLGDNAGNYYRAAVTA